MRLVVALVSVIALAFAAPAAADRPEAFPIFDVFEDVNPCTGNVMTVTFTGTFFVHEHGSRVVVRGDRTITTSDGFAGHGTDTLVDNGQVLVFRQTDIMMSASGDKFRARGLFVLSLRADTERLERFSLTCLGP
jgi:hypothetical protein